MERYELKRDDPVEHLIDAAERSGEVAIVRDGSVVATVRREAPKDRAPERSIDWEALDAFHARLPAGLRGTGTSALIREIRDMDDH